MRFDVKEHKWEDRAPLRDYRFQAQGVSTQGKIFVFGGYRGFQYPARSCEVYNIEADQWHFIANLTVPRVTGKMVLVGEVWYVLCGLNSDLEDEWTVECYDQEKNKWSVKTRFPVETWLMHGYFDVCSFRLYRRDFAHLEVAKF